MTSGRVGVTAKRLAAVLVVVGTGAMPWGCTGAAGD